MKEANEILVLGAGVMGLTAAVCLQEAGFTVEIWAKEIRKTTSHLAGAIWYPHKIEPAQQTRDWAKRSYEVFCELAESEAGVVLKTGKKFFHRRMGLPWWRSFVRGFRRLSLLELENQAVTGYEFVIPRIEMSTYLNTYLSARFLEAGGIFLQREVTSLNEGLSYRKRVVNATGLGASALANDSSLVPIRGQQVRVSALQSETIILDTDHADGAIYLIPRMHDAILGSTSEKGATSLEPCEEITTEILKRNTLFCSEISDAKILEVQVGLRPGRPAVRFERESFAAGEVWHHYGHGGAGVTLSWGAAESLRDKLLEQK